MCNLITLPADSTLKGIERHDGMPRQFSSTCLFVNLGVRLGTLESTAGTTLRPLQATFQHHLETFGNTLSVIFIPLGPLGTLFRTPRAYLWAHAWAAPGTPEWPTRHDQCHQSILNNEVSRRWPKFLTKKIERTFGGQPTNYHPPPRWALWGESTFRACLQPFSRESPLDEHRQPTNPQHP